MKKTAKILVSLLVILCISLVLISCDENVATYKITLKDGDIQNVFYVEENADFSTITPKDRIGYNFLGWYDGDTLLDDTFKPTSDMTVESKWEKYANVITLVSGDERVQIAVVFGESYTLDAPTPIPDCTFLGWYNGEELVEGAITPESDLTVTAKWQEDAYKITLINQKDTSTATVNRGDEYTLTDPEAREGYTFLGWFDGETQYSGTFVPSKSLTLEAKWQANELTLTLKEDADATPEVKKVLYNERIKLTNPQAREGYKFLGWYDAETNKRASTYYYPKTNATLIGKWEVITYKITLTQNGTSTVETVEYGKSLTLPFPTLNERLFLGWYDEQGTKVEGSFTPQGNATLTGKWDKYAVTIVDGESKTTVYRAYNELYTFSIPEAREGYEFNGWYNKSGKLISYTIRVTSDVTATSKWEANGSFATELKEALKTYLSSSAFETTILSAKTTQARIPLLYLKYVDGKFYTDKIAVQLKKYLNMIDGIYDNGTIKDSLFATSLVSQQGWYGIADYLYSWSAMYNQYLQWLSESGNADTTYSLYLDAIKDYLSMIDAFNSNSQVKYVFKDKEITQANLYYTGYNAINNIAVASSRLSYDDFATLLSLVEQATGNKNGHSEFLKAYKKVDFDAIDASSDKNAQYSRLKTSLMPLWKGCLPVTQCAFGYSLPSVLALTAYNLGFDLQEAVPNSKTSLLAYYEKDENGNFKRNGGTPNWVGFTGRALASTTLRNEAEYDVKFEKTMQGYFPFTDGWSQPLDEMVNMDRLCNWYNHDLKTGSNVDARYGILYGYMNGIDMEHYTKEVYHSAVCKGDECKYHIDEADGQVYNIISMWKDNLTKDANGKVKITGTMDMAVAIVYLAKINGVEAPSPVGVYSSADSVIVL